LHSGSGLGAAAGAPTAAILSPPQQCAARAEGGERSCEDRCLGLVLAQERMVKEPSEGEL